MKHLVVIIIMLVIAIYHIKSTDYSMTVYLFQIFMALITYRIIVGVRAKRNAKRGMPK